MHCSKEEKEMWVEDWKQSGKTAWAYARENGLIPTTFFGWTKSKTKTKKGFVEIGHRSIITPQSSEILIEKGDVKIHVPLSIGSTGLRTVMEGLGVAL